MSSFSNTYFNINYRPFKSFRINRKDIAGIAIGQKRKSIAINLKNGGFIEISVAGFDKKKELIKEFEDLF